MNLSRLSYRPRLFLLGATAIASLARPFTASADPNFNERFFNWGTRSPNTTAPYDAITPTPNPGHDAPPADSTWMKNSIANTFATYPNSLRAFVFQSDTSPLNGATQQQKETITRLATFLDPAKPIHYIFSDYEHGWTTGDKADVIEAANELHNSTNAALQHPYYGQYGLAPHTGTTAPAWYWWPNSTTPDINDQGNSYFTLGVNMANSNAYPYAYYDQHYKNSGFGTNKTPSLRAAFFWTPLERVSHGLRGFADATISRQAGAAPGTEHRKIPWFDKFVPWNGYTTLADSGIPADNSDTVALLQHYRLRGCDGFNNLGITSDATVLSAMIGGWRALDAHFGTVNGAAPTQVPTFLNLNTTKTSWTQWSAARVGNNIDLLVSNLATTDQTVTLPDVLNGEGGLPASVTAPANAHTHFTYTIVNALDNGRFTTNSSGWYFVNGSYQATGSPSPGSPGHARIGPGGGSFALTSPNVLMTPTTAVQLNLNANFEGSARLRVKYYLCDKSGAVMHNSSGASMWADTGLSVSQPADGNWYNFARNFTVPNNEQIGYISFIFYLYHSDGNAAQATDAVHIDDVVVTFP
jgi:hypothetical protein